MSDYKYLLYDSYDDGTIVRITLNRPEVRNAQHRGLLLELDEAFLRAEADDQVRVVILAGAGETFSAGHDLGTSEQGELIATHPSYRDRGGSRGGAEAWVLQEWHYFFNNTRRWRDLRKITVAQVQGPVFAAGLMLMWCCDLIVAAEDATFTEVAGTRMGMCGVEYFAHPWEFGLRKTKELILTGDAMDVHEAYALGMVSKVFAVDELPERTLEFARRIARVPTIGALLLKEAVNQTQDIQGFYNALNASFTLHELNHSHWAQVHENGTVIALPEDGATGWGKDAPPSRVARKDEVGA